MSRVFVAAWLLGAGALVVGEWWDAARLALLPAGLVLTAVGAWTTRRTRTPAGLVEHAVVRAGGIDFRRYARLAGLLVTVLGVAWMASGLARALT